MKNVRCNLCSEDNYRLIHKGLKDDESISLEKVYASSSNIVGNEQIVECKNCSFRYVNPQLESKGLIHAYSEGSDEKFISQNKWRMVTFRRCLKEVEKATKGKKGKILDIGAAGGAFPKVAQDAGWEVYGVEPNKWLCKWCKENYNIKIENGTLDTAKFKSKTFDAITLWDVLEHVPDPANTLKKCHTLLKDDGVLIINYPDMASLPAKLMRKKWVFLLSVHIYYFTQKTMRKMLHKVGFKPIKFKNHWQTLSLGYLAYRMEAYSKVLAKITSLFVRTFHLQEVGVPYWLGQTLVIAKKKTN